MQCPPIHHVAFCRSSLDRARQVIESTPGFVNELRDELVAAAQRKIDKRKNRHRRTMRGLTVLITIVATTSVLRLSEKPSEAGVLDVHRSGGIISVDLKTTSASNAQIVSELHRYGVEAVVNKVPVSISGVGKFVTVGNQNAGFSASSIYFRHFTLPDQKHQQVNLWLGRNARDDEPYAISFNAYAQGEPLHCSNTLGRKVKDALPLLQQRQMHLQWQQFGENTPASIDAIQNSYIDLAVSDRNNSIRIYVSAEPLPLAGSATDCE